MGLYTYEDRLIEVIGRRLYAGDPGTVCRKLKSAIIEGAVRHDRRRRKPPERNKRLRHRLKVGASRQRRLELFALVVPVSVSVVFDAACCAFDVVVVTHA